MKLFKKKVTQYDIELLEQGQQRLTVTKERLSNIVETLNNKTSYIDYVSLLEESYDCIEFILSKVSAKTLKRGCNLSNKWCIVMADKNKPHKFSFIERV